MNTCSLPEPDPGVHRLLAGVGNLPGPSQCDPVANGIDFNTVFPKSPRLRAIPPISLTMVICCNNSRPAVKCPKSSCSRSDLALHLKRLFDSAGRPTTKPRVSALRAVTKEVVEIYVLLTSSLFGVTSIPALWNAFIMSLKSRRRLPSSYETQ
jgi:hypothetical protein